MEALLIAAALAQTFNLVCAGSQTLSAPKEGAPEPYAKVYRIDLAQGLYCEGECKVRQKIAEIRPTELRLVSTKETTTREHLSRYNIIDRLTGKQSLHEFSDSRLTGTILLKGEGTCERQKFTGFPSFETKF